MQARKVLNPTMALALATMVSAISFSAIAANQEGAIDPVVTPAGDAKASPDQLMKLSQDGYASMRAVRAARIAIFNGEPAMAAQMLDQAKSSLDAATKDAPNYVRDTKASVEGKIVDVKTNVESMVWIPIDGELALADNYVVTPEKTAHIGKANEQFAKGASKEALEELRLAGINAVYARVLMPLDATGKQVDQARNLLGERKYYEANLALKAAEDGLKVDSVSLNLAPEA